MSTFVNSDRRPPRPAILPVTSIDFPEVRQLFLSNGMPVYLLIGGSHPVVKMEVVFDAGRPHETKRLVATTCAAMLREGTTQLKAHDIASTIDHLGASLSSPFSFDVIRLQLHCLTKHVHEALPIWSQVAIDPTFPEDELALYKQRTVQRLAVDLSHNDVLAYRKATELFFGSAHPYGYNSTAAGYQEVARADLLAHHQRLLNPQNASIFVAGQPPADMVTLLEDNFGAWQGKGSRSEPSLSVEADPSKWLEEDRGKQQSAIRVGRRLFRRSHPDFPAMLVLNTLLGGYFGSRLMRNVREQKGLTYGIESSMELMKYDGYFSISLETDRVNVKPVLREIDREIIRLQEELVTPDELNMVKNYLSGYVVSLMDGPLRTIQLVISHVHKGLPVDSAIQTLEGIKRTTAERVQQLAIKYLQTDALTRVIIH